MKIQLGAVSLAVSDIASQGNAILGIRDSGKTWAAILLAEKLMAAGIPIIAFDPIGRWRHLGTPGAGKGFPIVVAGGEHGDLPLTPQSAPEIVRAAMRERVSLVLDLYSMELSKADWRRIVASAVQTLLYENKAHGLRHLFIEEAAEFCPQIVGPDAGKVYDQIERLARMGGNALLGYTLINQRAEQVNKAVLELCDNLLLFRQKGKNSLTSLSKWLDIGSASQGKEIIGSLPTLPQGTCWVWAAGTDHPVKVKMPGIQTFSPDRRAQHAAGGVMPARVDVGKFVEGMKGALEKVLAEAEANDPKLLRAEIAKLKREAGQQGASEEELDAAHGLGRLEGEADERKRWLVSIGALESSVLQLLEADHQQVRADLGMAFRAVKSDAARTDDTQGARAAFERAKAAAPANRPPSGSQMADRHPAGPAPLPKPAPNYARGDAPQAEGSLKPALQRCIDAIAWWSKVGKEPIERARAAVVAGYSPRASTFGVYVAELAGLGLVDTRIPGKLSLTADGITAANWPTATTREDLYQMAAGLLKPQERRAFDAIYAAFPKAIRRDDVARKIGLSPTASTAGVYISAVAGYGIIETADRGEVIAADWLFP